MPRIILNAYQLLKVGAGYEQYALDIGGRSNAPQKTVEIKNLADCKREFQIFVGECVATGKPWHCSTLFDKRSGRKPAGFDKAYEARELRCNVNAHLVTEGGAREAAE